MAKDRYPFVDQKYLSVADKKTAYIRNVICNDHMWAGRFSTCNDEIDAGLFATKNVKYHADQCPLIIGNFVQCAPGVTFIMYRANHALNGLTTYRFGCDAWQHNGDAQQSEYKGPTIVGNDVWIGYKAIIMPGVTISDGVIVGAFSVVTKDVAPYTVVAGNPARIIRRRFSEKVINDLLTMYWWYYPEQKIVDIAPYLIANDQGYIAKQAAVVRQKRKRIQSNKTATAVVITVDRPVDMIFFLASLLRQTYQYDELVIIDEGRISVKNDSRVGVLLDKLISQGCQIVYQQTEKIGRASAQWLGISKATKDLVSLFEDDYVVGDAYLEQILTSFVDKDCDGVGGRVVHNKEPLLVRWYRGLFGLGQRGKQAGLTRAGHPLTGDGSGEVSQVDVLCGPASYRRSKLQEQFFDIGFDKSWEWQDMALSQKIAELYYVPAAYVYHTKSPLKKLSYVQEHEQSVYGYTRFFYVCIYSQNKKQVLAYWWALTGILIHAFLVMIITRRSDRLRACWRGWHRAHTDMKAKQ